ncbi:hypothetical protein EJ04DRAFT_218507 [Polyplosphaeria fusca]|uniref:Zn(2)-C6 fungal-type domain-containing protein n=1 Tax=Polyplosphaeria fusca TaxID=682080 RepID=A0A9P4V230_9PLEO|nr:hypothetical protein EJ04DRAFT_218507 [Polyplosphaeria fusca]
MDSAPRSKLLRVQSARSSLGCRTCKSRHVKCDEGRPQCQRCLKARITCTYGTAPEPSQPARKFVIYSIPRPLSETPDLVSPEKRSLYYFRCRAALQMTEPFRSRLWVDCVFQFAERHSFVMSALVALSIMHESYSQSPDLRDGYRADAIHYYNKAMRELSNTTQSEPSIHAVLVSSMIFYSLESLRGSFHRAMQHIQSALKIMSQYRRFPSAESHQPSLLDDSLDRDFLALQNQIMEIGTPGRSRAFDPLQGFNPSIPIQFESVEDALYYLEVVFNEVHSLIDYYEKLYQSGSVPADVLSADIQPRYEKIFERFSHWTHSFSSLDPPLNGNSDSRQDHALLLLRMYQLLIKVIFDNVFIGNCFEQYNADLATFLTLAEIYLQTDNQDAEEGTLPTFSLSLGIVPPLFMLAYRCNYAPVRDKSLELLKVHRKREGVWDSATALQLAQRIITVKSQPFATESNATMQVANIQFVSETACRIDFVITTPPSEQSGTWFPTEDLIMTRKHVEVVHLESIQFLE